MSDDALKRAWRALKAGEDPGDEGRAALREHERRLGEETSRPRITTGAFTAAEKYAKKHGISVSALLDHLIQAKVNGELVDARDHRLALEEREVRILDLERETDRLDRRAERERSEARDARAETTKAVDAWMNALERAIGALDFAGVPEPDPQDFLGPSESDTTSNDVAGGAG